MERGVRHIVGRVNHPQTNGKIERFYGTLEAKLHYFGDVDAFMEWYNSVRYHMSLMFNDFYETPDEAFIRKLPPEKLLGMAMEVLFNE